MATEKQAIWQAVLDLAHEGINMQVYRNLIDSKPEGMELDKWLLKQAEGGDVMRKLQAEAVALHERAKAIGHEPLMAASRDVAFLVCLSQYVYDRYREVVYYQLVICAQEVWQA